MSFFKRIFFVFIIFYFVFNSQSYSEIIKKVKVLGNDRVSLETIMVFGDITIGSNYESEDINLLIKKLYETTFFSNISIDLENGNLSIVVAENPIINSVIFEGEKAKKYKKVLHELIVLREKTSFLRNNIKSDINIIKEFYRNLGFYFVKIDAVIKELTKNRIDIVYSIDKGNKAKISKIFFIGDKKIRDKRLSAVITSQESKVWKVISKNVYLNKGRIELDKRLLTNYYKNKGFYEVEVSSSNVEYSEGEGFILTFSINAGTRYKFKKIFANVSESLDKKPFVSLEKDFNNIIGDYYSLRKLTSLLEKIDKLSEKKELQFINHSVSETLVGNGIEVKINIFEGQKFLIERINIVGNSVTNDSVIRSELLVDEGDPYSALLVNKSINRLKGRGIFSTVTHEIIEGSLPDLKVLKISIEEKATGEIMAGAGVGTDGTAFMFALSENNWLGRGIKVEGGADISKSKISGNLSVVNPNYNYTGNVVYSSLNISSTDAKDTSGYESSKTGFSLGTKFEQYENVYLSPSIDFSYEDISADSTATATVKKMEGSFTNIDFGYGISLDKRNQSFQPTDGYKTEFIQTLPLLQDSSSILTGLSGSIYHAMSENVIGSIKYYARSVHGVDGDVRLTNRLFLPSKRLRGFQASKVGPVDGDDFVGGNFATSLGFEAALPNLLPEAMKTDISVFLDTGNVWSVDYNESLEDSNKIRSSVGISANVFTMIGPLSFTLAQDITKASTDLTETFNFRLGTSF